MSVGAPTASDYQRSAHREDCKLTVMTKRKKTFFPEIKRVILGYEYVETPKDYQNHQFLVEPPK